MIKYFQNHKNIYSIIRKNKIFVETSIMKAILFAITITFLFTECKKDIKFRDKRNDCKDCILYYFSDFQGNKLGFTYDDYNESNLSEDPESPFYKMDYCEYIDYLTNINSDSWVDCK